MIDVDYLDAAALKLVIDVIRLPAVTAPAAARVGSISARPDLMVPAHSPDLPDHPWCER
jgi:hypothetical protein